MKKIISIIIMISILMTTVISGCSSLTGNNGKIRIIATVFPAYDWTRNIVGDSDNVELKLLIDNGVDLHSFQPTTDDIIDISTCDLLIYVGGESDKWIEDVIKDSQNKDMTVICLMDILGDDAVEEEFKEGMEEEASEEDEGPEYDEHVWLSPEKSIEFSLHITETLTEMDPGNRELYEDNMRSYGAELEDLSSRYKAVCDDSEVKTLLFADRFPFRYLTEDYGIDYYAAFAGCSAETEASFETVIFLAGKIDELGLDTILIIDGSDGDLARTVRDNTESKDQKILTLDSMQSVTEEEIKDGVTYIQIMEKNLDVLKTALGE